MLRRYRAGDQGLWPRPGRRRPAACNRFLRQALLRWACCSLTRSAWARASYDRHRQGGKTHHSALRILAHRWLGILHHLLATGQPYDEAVHQRNRTRASENTAA